MSGEELVFEGPSSPVVYNGRVYVAAQDFEDPKNPQNKLVALDRRTGAVMWETLIAATVFDFWYSPAVDTLNDAVLIGTGNRLYGIDAVSGAIDWSTPLMQSSINAGAVVASDLDPGRAFITDYDGFGTSGSVYCINTSPFDASTNPFQAGDIVWFEPIGGSSGNTPAYDDGVVYVASVGDASLAGITDAGRVFAFDVDAPAESRLLWSVTIGEGFFGGIAYANGFVYAASYDFDGSGDNSTLVKIDTADGNIQWTVECERTNSTPIVKGTEIYLSAGFPGSGSVPKIQAFEDMGGSARKIWDTFYDTSGVLLVGGWTHQPVLVGDDLYAGTIPTGFPFFGPYTDLYVLDTTKMPADSGFIIDHAIGMGSSPAICGGTIYTIGASGLHAVAGLGDFCGPSGGSDGAVDGVDVGCYVAAMLSAQPTASETALGDFDGDGVLGLGDVPGFIAKLLEP